MTSAARPTAAVSTMVKTASGSAEPTPRDSPSCENFHDSAASTSHVSRSLVFGESGAAIGLRGYHGWPERSRALGAAGGVG